MNSSGHGSVVHAPGTPPDRLIDLTRDFGVSVRESTLRNVKSVRVQQRTGKNSWAVYFEFMDPHNQNIWSLGDLTRDEAEALRMLWTARVNSGKFE